MKIGFDLDGVVFPFAKFLDEFVTPYFKKKRAKEIFKKTGEKIEWQNIKDEDVINDPTASTNIAKRYGVTEKEAKKFWRSKSPNGNSHFMEYVKHTPAWPGYKELFEQLLEDGHEIVLPTQRKYAYNESLWGKQNRKWLKERLKKDGLIEDFGVKNLKFIYVPENSTKEEIIERNDIDVMVEDTIENAVPISKVQDAKSLLMKTIYNEHYENEDLIEVRTPEDIYNVIQNIVKEYNEPVRDPESPLTGIPSVDKPYEKYVKKGHKRYSLKRKTIYKYMKDPNIDYLDDLAIVYFSTKITYRELFAQIEKTAKLLVGRGIKEGNMVHIALPNSPEAIYLYYAAIKIGAVPNLIHPLAIADTFKAHIQDKEFKILFAYDKSAPTIKSVSSLEDSKNIVYVSPAQSMQLKDKLEAVKKILAEKKKKKQELTKEEAAKLKTEVKTKVKGKDYSKSWGQFVKEYNKKTEIKEIEYKENRLAQILSTGGTTGLPNQIMISDDNINSIPYQARTTVGFKRQSTVYAASPIFHGFGLDNCIHAPLTFGVTLILEPQFDVDRLLTMLEEGKVNHLLAVPALFIALCDNERFLAIKDLSALQTICTGGDDIREKFEEKFNKILSERNCNVKLQKGYGLTQAVSSVIWTHKDINGNNELGYVGRPTINSELKIVKPGTHEEVGYNEEGEITIHSTSVMLGIRNNPEETARQLQIHEDKKERLHSSDLGHMNENGSVKITGRLVDMYIQNGYNVYPSRGENILIKHPAVKECAIIGIPCEKRGETGKAFIALKPEFIPTEKLIFDILKTFNDAVGKSVEGCVRIDTTNYQFVNEIPKTPLRKIDKSNLRKFHQITSVMQFKQENIVDVTQTLTLLRD